MLGESKKSKIIFLFLFVLLLISFNLRPISDFDIYYEAAKNFILSGSWTNVYEINSLTPFKYHPSLVFFFLPFSFLPLKVSTFLWALINTILLYFSLVKLKELFSLSDGKVSWLIFLIIHPLSWQVKFRNIPILLLFFLILSQNSKNFIKEFWLSLIIIFKPNFSLILIPFFIKRKWRSLLMISVCGIIISLFPFFFGLDFGYESYEMWFKTLLSPIHSHNYSKTDNQTIFGLLTRIFDSQSLIFLLAYFGATLFVLFLWLRFYLIHTHDFNVLVYSMVPVILWIGPLCWIHNQILLLPILAFAIKEPANKKILFISWVLLDGIPFLGEEMNRLIHKLGIPMIGYLIFLFVKKRPLKISF